MPEPMTPTHCPHCGAVVESESHDPDQMDIEELIK